MEHLLEGMRDIESRDAALHAKRMFGGYGIFLDGRMFALVADGELYLKADAGNSAGFDKRNLPAFTYESSRGTATMSYRHAPPEFVESPERHLQWARAAVAASKRSGTGKRG